MTVAAHGGDIYQNQITYDFSVNTNPLPLPEILQKRMAEAAVHSNRYPQYGGFFSLRTDAFDIV